MHLPHMISHLILSVKRPPTNPTALTKYLVAPELWFVGGVGGGIMPFELRRATESSACATGLNASEFAVFEKRANGDSTLLVEWAC